MIIKFGLNEKKNQAPSIEEAGFGNRRKSTVNVQTIQMKRVIYDSLDVFFCFCTPNQPYMMTMINDIFLKFNIFPFDKA